MLIFGSSLQAFSAVIHGFTTRVDSSGQVLDLGASAGASAWARVARDLGVAGLETARISQVHGADVVWARSPGAAGQADAVITDVPGLLIAVRTADCVPILVAGEGVVAAIHAGWRGLAAGVIPTAIAELQGRGPLTAVVGPSICMDCYEVGEEVVEGIARWVSPTHFVDRSREKPHVDGGAAAVAQLQAAGVAHVEQLKLCTRCDARLWSHREEGSAAGRQAAVVGLRC
jgi:YfiH family protein